MTKVDGKGPTRSRAWHLYLLLGLVGVLGYSFLPSDTSHNLYYSAMGIAAVAVMATGVRLNRPSFALPWYLVIGGQTLLVVGDGIWNYYEMVLRVESPFPSVADVAYLGGYVVLVAGWPCCCAPARRATTWATRWTRRSSPSAWRLSCGSTSWSRTRKTLPCR